MTSFIEIEIFGQLEKKKKAWVTVCETTYRDVVFRIIEKKIGTCGCTERIIWSYVSSAYLH